MPDKNFDPNARYNSGPSAAGCGRASTASTMQAASTTGLNTDGTMGSAEVFTGFHAAGVKRNNTGPNVAGAQRSINGT